MGQSDSKDSTKLTQLFQQYTTLQTFHEHDRFGESKLLQSKKNPHQRVLLKEINITDETHFNKAHRKYEMRAKLNHPNIVNVTNHFYILEQQLCGQFYKVFVVLEFVPNLLSDYIDQGVKEPELWSLLNGAIQGLAYLQQNSIHHDNVNDNNIYINTEEMSVKVADPSYFTQTNMFVQTLQDNTNVHNFYLSPALVKAIHANNWQPKHNSYKSDVFSLGMVLLHAAMGQSCDDCYMYDEGIFRDDILISKLTSLKLVLSDPLIQVLTLMTCVHEDQRPDFIQLVQMLKNQHASTHNSSQNNISEPVSCSHNHSILEPSYHSNQQPAYYQSAYPQSIAQQPQPDIQLQYPVYQEQRQRTIPEAPQPQQPVVNIRTQPLPATNAYHLRPPNTDVVMHRDTSQQSFHVSSTKNSRQPLIAFQTQQPQVQPIQPVINIPAPVVNQQPMVPLQKDTCDSLQAMAFLDHPAKSSATDENADPLVGRNDDTNQLKATRKYEDPLQMSKANEFQPLQDYTNLFQKHDQLTRSTIQSSFKKESERVQEVNQKLHLNYTVQYPPHEQTKRTQVQLNATYNHQDQYESITNDRFSLPFDLPNIPSTYNIKCTEYDVSNTYEDRQFANNNIQSEQKDLWKIQVQPPISQQQTNSNTLRREETTYVQSSQQQISQTIYQQQQVQNTFQQPQAAINYQQTVTHSSFMPSQQTAIYQPVYQPQQVAFQPPVTSYQPPQNTYQQQQSYFGVMNSDQNNKTSFLTQMQQPSVRKQHLPEYVVEHYSNGSRYEGEKLDGMRHGQGKFFYQDGGLYEGGWKENKMHGRGVLYYATGKPAYDGEWVEDKFQGFGTLFNETPIMLQQEFDFRDFDNVEEFWIKYQGEFNDDNKEGEGTLFLSNGEKFVGSFSKDYINGAGLFYCLNRRVIDGRWSNNKLIE